MSVSTTYTPDFTPAFWKDRLRASAIHFSISLVIAVMAALLVFGVMYPYPYWGVSGGTRLFMLIVIVDVILGPLITLTIFDRRKSWPVLRRDLSIVALIQLVALGYGIWTMYAARPVHLAFEIDRFRVVHAIEIEKDMLEQAPAGLQKLPLFDPTLVAVRPFKSNDESWDATILALQGHQMGARPELWKHYKDARPEILAIADPADELVGRFPDRKEDILAAIAETGRSADKLVYLPMVSRGDDVWTVFMDSSTTEVLGFLDLDPF